MALLEQVLEGFAQHVHYHDVIHLAILGFLVSGEMEVRDSSFLPEYLNDLGLPKKHYRLLFLDSLDLCCIEFTCLLFLDLINFSETSPSKSFNNFVSFVKDLLSFFHLNIDLLNLN